MKTKKGNLTSPGYFTIPVGSTALAKGERFSVVVRLTTKGYEYPVPVEMPVEDYTKKVKARKGQSFGSENGIEWVDLHEAIKKTNVCLKAFTK